MAATSPSEKHLMRRRSVPQVCRHRGLLLLEVAISLVIIALGAFSLLGLNMVVQESQQDAYHRAQALILLNDMVERINANRYSAGCFAFTTDTTAGQPYLGVVDAYHATPSCALGANPAGATRAMSIWDQLLQGAAEIKSGTSIGAVPSARGCVSLDATTGTYTIAVSWQGQRDLFTPSVACGKDQYGSESKRRVVWTTLQIANLQ